MMVKPCRTYRSRTVRRSRVAMPDGKSIFKLYFLDIVERDDPARFEWAHCGREPESLESRVQKAGLEGIGFITAFPHIAKVFRFAPAMETVLHVRAFQTADLEPLDLGRDDGYLEFACYAEAAIAADEYQAWARAGSVEDYLKFLSPFDDGPIACNAKLAAWYHP